MRTIYPTYYNEAINAAYPFESLATRNNGTVFIEDDIFVDGRFFPPDGRHDLYLSSIVVQDEVTLVISNANGEVGRGYFNRNSPPETVNFYAEGRDNIYVGLLQGFVKKDTATDPNQRGLQKIAGWSNGTYIFTSDQTRFAASVVVPQPQAAVRSIRLDSGAVFYGDVILVGENGVQFTNPSAIGEASSSSSSTYARFFDGVIRMDVVGDPLFVRRGCDSESVPTDQDILIQKIVFDGKTVLPDARGGFTLSVGTESSNDSPALRITPVQNGLEVNFI